ncbi:AzlC family ABC transporter permease [Streptomyces sp. BE20]|uniref:AzlC family ABC transporter permease n=1 Tax=Streptomyces sp. BE20 TaxID=3002525 RepID=UPI002E77B299|nr:AzlC family ABC transporter permease [Streptomyces sp. BE20]MEE1823653.1 AzlC family ABC transporter permease [Streptomyces sp. BE20]
MRSLLRTLERSTLRDIALVCLADALVGASFGAITVSGGLPLWVPVVMSVLVFAGGAQFAAIGVVLSGGGALAAVATGLVLNARLLPFGFTVAGVLDGPWWRRLLGAQLLTDESVAFTLLQPDRRRRRAAYWVCGLALFAVWNASVLVGAAAGGMIGDTDALGLDAAFPAVLLALVLPSLTDPRTRTAALAGAVVAVAATPFLPAGVPVLLALSGLLFARRPADPARPADTADTARPADTAVPADPAGCPSDSAAKAGPSGDAAPSAPADSAGGAADRSRPTPLTEEVH